MTAWMVVTSVAKSSTSWEIETFITAWSRTIRNWAAPSTDSTFHPPLAMPVPRFAGTPAPMQPGAISAGKDAPGPSGVVRAPSTRRPRTTDPRAMGAGASQTVLSGLVREVAGILRRQWLLAVPPAALLGAGAGVVVVARKELGAELALGVLLAVAFEFYVGWAELVVAADRGEGPPPRVRGM